MDAYESLQLAANRPGAPLCGNPVWQDTVGYVYGGYWQRNHGLTVESNATRLYFIDRSTGNYWTLDRGSQDVRSLAVSEDGKNMMLEAYRFTSSTWNTPTDVFNSGFSNCSAEFRRLNLTGASPTTQFRYATPLVRNQANCYSSATFAP